MSHKPLADEYLALHPETPPALKKLILRYEATVNGFKGECERQRERIDRLESANKTLKSDNEATKKQFSRLLVINTLAVVFVLLFCIVFLSGISSR